MTEPPTRSDRTILPSDLGTAPLWENERGAPGVTTELLPFGTFVGAVHESPLAPTPLPIDHLEGRVLGKYRLGPQIGSGSFGRVYEARHKYLDYPVAIKVWAPGPGRDQALIAREVQALAVLNHPNVVRVLDAEFELGTPFMVMEHLAGESLRSALHRHGRLTIERAWDFVEAGARVLVRQEEESVLHLDIKPDNVHVRRDGSFCFVDYGLFGVSASARAVRRHGGPADSTALVAERGFGTRAYAAPEQWADGEATHKSDLYGLGITAWECLAGRRARDGADADVTQPVPNVQGARADAPDALSRVLESLVAVEPGDRYDRATDLYDDVCAARYRGERAYGRVRGRAMIAMPFAPEYDPAYDAIHDGCRAARLRPRRLDREAFVQDVWSQCVQEIEAAHVVVADFSRGPSGDVNSNVVTEAAHARAIGKSLVLISRDRPEDMPFDWRHMPFLTYEVGPGGYAALSGALRARLESVLASLPATPR